MLSPAHMQYAPPQSPAFGAISPQLQRSSSYQPNDARRLEHFAHDGYAPTPSAYDMRFGDSEDTDANLVTNAVTKHPKVKLKIILSDHQFEAGGSISGALEITSSTSQRLRLGEIAVELEAFEELNSRDHSATQIFLFNRTLFQGEHLPPSNAVLPAAPVHGHWTARKGRTTFPFSFRLPSSIASSVTFAGNAHLRYLIKGSAQTWWNESKSLVTVRSETAVLEKWEDEFDPRYLEPIEAVADSHIFMGGSGAVWLEAGVSEQLFTAGGSAIIRAGIKNNTKRTISGIKVAIARRLILGSSKSTPAQRNPLEPQVTEVMHTQVFKGHQFEFPPGEEVMTSLPIEIPREIRTIRKTRLFAVEIVMQVSAQMGNFAKDLMVEFPIYVAHPSSLSSSSQARALNPVRGLPQRSRSAMSQHGYHDIASYSPEVFSPSDQLHQFRQAQQVTPSPLSQMHFDPQMMHLQQYGDNRGWSPAPMMIQAPPPRPTSAATDLPISYSNQWQFSQEVDHSQSLHQYYDRPHSAMELARQYSTPHQSDANDMRRQPDYDHHRQYIPSTNLEPQQEHYWQVPIVAASTCSPQTPSPVSQPMSSITMSQLLNPGAIPLAGLTTIEEDSESAVGTIKSVRDIRGSVTRTDVANLEAIASMTEMSDLLPNLGDSEKIVEKEVASTREGVNVQEQDSSTASSSIRNDKTPVSQSKGEAEVALPRSTPIRPTSAQGMGLSALESRLGSQNVAKPVAILAKIGRTKGGKVDGSKATQSGALRAAAIASAKRQNEAREEVRKLETEVRKEELELRVRESNGIPVQGDLVESNRPTQEDDSSRVIVEASKSIQAPVSPKKITSPAEVISPRSKSSEKARKTVDLVEQKKLNKEAVGRVTGWLSSSSSPSKPQRNQSEDDVNTTARTPSPSVIKEMHVFNVKAKTPPSTLLAINGASHKGNDEMPTLSADLRALIDSSGLDPPPKAGNAIKSHIASQRFSGKTNDKQGVLIATSREAPQIIAKVTQSTPASGKLNTMLLPSTKKSSAQLEEETKYDIRSARGGRGGRVASVANMWASIADGTDGSEMKNDEIPVLTLRPKALRGNALGSAKLDFSKSKSKVEEVRKASAREIFRSGHLDRENQKEKAPRKDRMPNPPLKTAKAAHFINTTMPKPVFAKATMHVSPNVNTKPIIAEKEEIAAGKLKQSRKVMSDLIALEGKLKAGGDLSDDKIHIAILPMNGRGTTKAIGRDKLADLKSLWGG